tara:strand:+ start:436 stop:666 length:231 start_codon:yes stop_codon:yes gene_type:complete
MSIIIILLLAVLFQIKKRIIFGMFLLLILFSSCSINRNLTNEQLNKINKIEFQLNLITNEYNYKKDSLLIEYYKIN